MAKGQKRSSREIRKPKQVASRAEPASGDQISFAANANAPRGKAKR